MPDPSRDATLHTVKVITVHLHSGAGGGLAVAHTLSPRWAAEAHTVVHCPLSDLEGAHSPLSETSKAHSVKKLRTPASAAPQVHSNVIYNNLEAYEFT